MEAGLEVRPHLPRPGWCPLPVVYDVEEPTPVVDVPALTLERQQRAYRFLRDLGLTSTRAGRVLAGSGLMEGPPVLGTGWSFEIELGILMERHGLHVVGGRFEPTRLRVEYEIGLMRDGIAPIERRRGT